ncbi:MAG: phospholipase A [Pseudomonadota bacterium]
MPRGPIRRLLIAACSIAVSVTARADDARNVINDPRLFRAHKPNYILPLSTTNRVNRAVYTVEDTDLAARLKPEEVAFQMSLKVQLNADPLLRGGDAVFFGFTLKSWWQLYSPDISSPFRETNYQPEVFYTAPLRLVPFGADTTLTLGLEHQSNGQVQAYSRSWNRLYAELALRTERAFFAVRPWYRLPEDPKPSPDSALGDDNPDIDDFLGRGQVQLGWRGERIEISSTLHGSLSTGKGGLRLMLTYPLFKRFRGVVHYVDGYGDSLIDYNHKQRRLGLGVLLSDLF